MSDDATQSPDPPEPSSTTDPPGASGLPPSGRHHFPWRDRSFIATAIIAPLVVSLIGIGLTGGFSWIGDQFKEAKPPVYVSGSRSPRVGVSTKPPEMQPSGSVWTTPSQATPSASGQSEGEAQGIRYARSAYLCPWEAWVVTKPPDAFLELPVLEDGTPDPGLINDKTTGDPGATHLSIDIQPVDNRPLQVKELRIKVLERKAAPGADRATLVGLQNGQCGGGPEVLMAHADLDGSANFATVSFMGGNTLPQELVGGRALNFELTVDTRACDCVWVPEIVWSKDGETKTTEFRIDGKDFRTISTIGLERRAWKQDLNTHKWSKTVFDESILD
ncbi:hypothetical protein ACFWCA_29430 [Streptomyces phaeochromogenes]|uniref:hypothetical protein n=1 Tax=Streptomyces phaeochromogenes TaxID=1923 RepID=UPI0036B1BEF6